MAENIIVDGIIDVIKELREKAKCPFCGEQLLVNDVRTGGFATDDTFDLGCQNCKLELTLKRKRKSKWVLDRVRRTLY